MKKITYNDYKKYKDLSLKVNKKELIYPVTNIHDKIFRDLLNDKNEFIYFLDKKLNMELKDYSIEQCNTNFITKEYKSRQSDVIYKIKDKNVFFLVEHQSKIDYTMAYRILNYSIEIIRNVVEKNISNDKKYRYPKIIPIVLYTGDKIWNAKKNLIQITENLKGYKNYINVKYNLIDINNYKKEELIKENSLVSKMMAIEKSQNEDELIQTLNMIIEDVIEDKQKKKLKQILQYALIDVIGQDKILTFLEKLDKNKEVNISMLRENLLREKIMIMKEGEMKGKAEGKRESVLKIVKKMIQCGETDEKIQRYTGTTKKQIQSIRRYT